MPGSSGLPLAGVEAIVEGLSAFQGDVHQMNSALDSIRPRSTLLQRGFESLTDGIVNFGKGLIQWGVEGLVSFGEHIIRIAEYALGQLLADAINFIITKIRELISATIDAGSEFQTLELRLNGLNMQDIADSQLDYANATEAATLRTKEQLEWLQKLAATTPYDNTDISSVYTLARSYGFADEAAQELTESTTNFAAGMGLSGETLERVIMNMGQMVQRGKITSTEIRDLARGSFMPINDILERIAKNMTEAGMAVVDNSADIGKSSDQIEKYEKALKVLEQRESEFTDKTKDSTKLRLQFQKEELQAKIDATKAKMQALREEETAVGAVSMQDVMKQISTKEGLPAQLFIDAFNEMIAEEPRFQGAAERMAKTFKAASDNAQDVVKSIGGLQVVKPILDVLGEKVASFVSAFTDNPERWERLVGAADRLGKAVSGVVSGIFNLMPGADALAEMVIKVVDKAAGWVEEHGPDIINFFKHDVANAVIKVKEIIEENLPKIKTFFQEVGETIRDKVIPWIKDELIPFFGRMKTWVEENGPAIKDFFMKLGEILRDDVIPWFRNDLIPFLERIATWVSENGPTIKEFFLTLAEIGGTVFKDVMDWLGKKVEGDSILDSITAFMEFVIEKKDKIAEWVEILAKAFIIWQVLTTVWSIAMSVIIPLIGFVLGLVSVFVALNAVVAFLAPVVMALLPWLAGLAAAFIAVMVVVKLFQYIFELTKGAITILIDGIKQNFILLRDTVVRIWNEIVEAGKNGDWAGVAASIVNGLNNYVTQAWELLKETFSRLFQNLIDTVKNVLGIHSPSTIFMGFGQSLMEGIAIGILNGVNTVTGAIDHMGSVALEKINHWSSVIANALTFGFAGGIADTTPVAEAAGRDMVDRTNKTTRKKAKAFSPSKLFEQLGVDVAMGFAQGIERAVGLAGGAMQNAMSAAMVPAFSSMAGVRTNTVTNNRTANLTINSSAPVEPILQDFHMIETLIGA